jgi:hypothetical protein
VRCRIAVVIQRMLLDHLELEDSKYRQFLRQRGGSATRV